MSSVHFKRLLIHQAIVFETTPVQSASGELIDSWSVVGTIDCRFVQKREGIASEGVGFMMKQIDRLLCDAGESVVEENQVRSITVKATGASVDVGPFTIEELVQRNDMGAHHLSLRLERIE